MHFRHLFPLLATLSPLVHGASEPVTFEKHIRPILKAQCFHCHGEEGEMKGGLDVRLARFILKGGDEGPAIVPGKAAESHLLKMVQEGEMPKGKAKLKDKEIALIEQWISQGAKTARPEPQTLGPEHAFTDEDRAWWSLQPIRKPAVPAAIKDARKITNAIDAFVSDKLAPNQLSFSPEADAVTLIRRMSYDLTGLPPTPAEVTEFKKAVALNRETAIRALIDRLLASPHYGEKWGRHWLDVARYA
ncbi:MAG TPA: hypothetical protein DCP71_13690, partial [Verrucomicrobiales bacterium]|nr:hypothetical protein [Verrucomicrobiales bacterium]